MALVKLNKDGPLAVPVIEREYDDKGNAKVISASPDNLVHLVPGWNDIDDAVWEKIKPDIADRMKTPETGVAQIEIITMQQKSDPDGDGKVKVTIVPKPFLKLDSVTACEVVKGTFRKKTLDAWLESDGRSDVRASIMNQLESLKPKKAN